MLLKRAICTALLALLPVSLLAACTSSQATPSASTPTALTGSAPTRASAEPTCQTSQLILAYDASRALVANRADQFSFQNTSSSMCTLFGYPHIQILNADHQPISTHATPVTSAYLFESALKLVSLEPGARSYFVVEWVAGLCIHPPLGDFLQVTPPGNKSILTTSASAGVDGGVDTCQGNVVVSPVTSANLFSST